MLLNKQTYLKRFSRLVRWRLPAGEADDVTADYAELIEAHPQDGEALLKNLGTPFAAAMHLKPFREYRRWMTVFVLLGLCLVYFLCGLFTRAWTLHALNTWLFYLSTGLACFWKWKLAKGKRGKCPGLVPAVLGLLGCEVFLAGAAALLLYSFSRHMLPGEWYGPVIYSVLRGMGCLAFGAGFWGLIRCRTRDCRWLALTVLGLVLLSFCLTTTLFLRSLNNISILAFWAGRQIVAPVAIGMIGVIWTLW